MSLLEVNKITPQSGTTLTLGDAGDTINFGSGVLPNFENLTVTGDLTVDTNSLYIDSANNRVGIGTASPATALEISNNSPRIRLTDANYSTGSQVEIQGDNGNIFINADQTGLNSNRVIAFQLNNSEAMRIISSGNVGIGTSSPSEKLAIAGANTITDARGILSVNSTNAVATNLGGSISLGGENGQAVTPYVFGSIAGRYEGSSYAGYLQFSTTATGSGQVTERMRIDSSGNVLVNTTDTSLYNNTGASDGGFAINDSRGSYVQIARDDGTQLFLNLLGTNDGNMIGFYRSGTQVGSIGVDFTDNLVISGNSSHAGLNFGTASIIPYKNGTNLDATIDWGSSATQFKDLYLSGGAVIKEATLTDGATISWDVSTSSVAKVTLGGNRTLSAPSNALNNGQFISLLVIQDGTGSRTLTWNAVYEFASDTAPTLTTTGGKGDLFVFRYNGTKWLEVGRNLNLSLS